jgi:2-oxoglutarate ferredoxin oxidoreductase subunit delta
VLAAEKQSLLLASESASAEKTAPRVRRRGRVRVFRNWCKGCGLCIAFCPQQVFEEGPEHRPVVAHQERCIACRWCTIHCPDFAILVEEIDENRGEVAK